MRGRVHQTFVSGLAALLIASVAAPGLTMHNCRQFGTRSTQLCACCEAELESSRGCCAQKTTPAPKTVHAETVLGTSCCFTSHEGPFSFDGQGSTQNVQTSPSQQDLSVVPHATTDVIALEVDCSPAYLVLNSRHSSDPPSYILTHSFRC